MKKEEAIEEILGFKPYADTLERPLCDLRIVELIPEASDVLIKTVEKAARYDEIINTDTNIALIVFHEMIDKKMLVPNDFIKDMNGGIEIVRTALIKAQANETELAELKKKVREMFSLLDDWLEWNDEGCNIDIDGSSDFEKILDELEQLCEVKE